MSEEVCNDMMIDLQQNVAVALAKFEILLQYNPLKSNIQFIFMIFFAGCYRLSGEGLTIAKCV